MKSLKEIIQEKLKVSNLQYTLFPESKDELQEMIKNEIVQNGNECSLNHIDVTKITNMRCLFYCSNFNGDISKWDVSNVEIMRDMFRYSNFNNDISGWDISNVEDMEGMFGFSKFNQDISNWDISNVKNTKNMFSNSPLEKKIQYQPKIN